MAQRLATQIKKYRYRIMYRDDDDFDSPADPESSAANFATWLASFSEMGYSRDKTPKYELTEVDPEVLDDGNEVKMGWDLHLESELLEAMETNLDTLEALEGDYRDILFYCEVTGHCVWFGDVLPYFNDSGVGGETGLIRMVVDKKNNATKAAARTVFEEPTS